MAVSLMGAVAWALLTATTAKGLQITKYEGTVVGDHSAAVSFRVWASDEGVRRHADFRHENVAASYDDGTPRRDSAGPVRFTFQNDHVFYNDVFLSDSLGSERYEVRGRLLDRRRARGYLVHVVRYHDPPPFGWSTDGRVRWKAERV